ncbi:MAG: hypothetical protein L0Y54_01800 [Sporichthyaceae bacterium]|nr:hypothetical protein [Sporichthyaceae bacterium]
MGRSKAQGHVGRGRRSAVLAGIAALALVFAVPSAQAASISVKRNDYNRDSISDILAVNSSTNCLVRWYGNGGGGHGVGTGVPHGCLTFFSDSLTALGDINKDVTAT